MNDSIRQLVRDGRKIEAIKQVRALTGLGLKDAKEAVERLERGDAVSLPASPRDRPAVDADALAARIGRLVEEERMIEAVKEVRSATGLDLREAKQLVDRVAQGAPLGDPTRLPDAPLQPSTAQRAVVLIVAGLLALLGLALAVFLGG